MKKPMLTAYCIHCRRPIFSYSEGQLNHNTALHEANCIVARAATLKGDSGTSERPSPSSHS